MQSCKTLAAPTVLVTAVLALAFGLSACGDSEGDSESDPKDFSVADLGALNFAPDDLPGMEYQPDSSGPEAFSEDQRREAREEGDQSGLELVDRLEELGLEADHVSQFFATSRDSELLFVESIAFLFEDADNAEQAVEVVSDANAENLNKAEEIDPPQLGEQTFGIRGEFDGFPVYSLGWRVGDVIQLASVAPGDEKAGRESTLELAEQLASKAEAADATSREDYIAAANASCVEAERGASKALEQIIGEGMPTPAEAQRFLQAAVIPAIRSGLAEREALAAPEGDEETIAAINAAGREALAGFERIAADPAKAQALMLGELSDPAVEVDTLNRRYGVEECAGGN